MTVYGEGKYKAIVHWRGWRTSDTHKFMTPESRERFVQQHQRSTRISRIEKDPK